MFDNEIVLESLQQIRSALQTIIDRTAVVSTPDEFLRSPNGMLRLDAICMNLIALGEAVKGLDKQTHGKFLSRYPEIHWSGVMRMRDKIAHHYFEIDTDVVFRTIEEDVPEMLSVIEQMIADMRMDMNVEDEYYSLIEKQETELMVNAKEIARQRAELKDKDAMLSQKDAELSQKDAMLRETIKLLLDSGLSLEAVAASLGKDLETLSRLTGQAE